MGISPKLTTHTIVWYVSPDGVVIPLSGGPDAGRYQVWLGHEPENLGHVEVKALFDAAARQWGEEYIGETVDHAELELPMFILQDETGIDGLRVRREWFKRLVERKRVGWLAIYTNVTGWRWVAVRRGFIKPSIGSDPAANGGLELDVMLIVEQPLARVADSTDDWKNDQLTGSGSLMLNAGPEYESWPQFTFRGPGVLRVRYAGNDITHPAILADETLLINTDEARPTVRAIRDNGTKRNLLPLLKGAKYRTPLPVGVPTRVDLDLTGGNANSQVYGSAAIRIEGLL